MKANITKNFYISGYRNFSPYNLDNFEVCDVRVVPLLDSECKHLIVDNVLPCVHGTELLNTLKTWVSKLRIGGTITINDVDVYLVMRDYYLGRLNEIELNTILMGATPLELRKGLFNMSLIRNLLEELNLRVTKVRVENYEYTLEAVREN